MSQESPARLFRASRGYLDLQAEAAICDGEYLLNGAAFLVAGLVRFLIVILLEVPLLAVVQTTCTIALALAHALLICFVFRIVGTLVVILKQRSRHGRRPSTDSNAHHNRHHAETMLEVHSHKSRPFHLRRFGRGTPMAVRGGRR